MNPRVIRAGLDLEFLFFSQISLSLGDKPVFLHAINDVQLAGPRPFGVADRVVGRGRFGQSCQHGGLGDGDVLQCLSEIGVRSGRKSVGAIAQEDLIHIDLENLILGQQVFQLECQQDFVDFPGERFLGR